MGGVLAPTFSHLVNRLVPADFNGDGRVDLMSSGSDYSNVVLRLFSGGVIPQLTINTNHAASFMPGQTGATFNVVVGNAAGSVATAGTVSVTYYAVQSVLALDSLAGEGWTCSIVPPVCTRSDSLAPGSSYPPITVTADVRADATAPQQLFNLAIASGGGSQNAEFEDIFSLVSTAVCTYTLAPASVSLGSNPTAGSVTVTTTPGCFWTAVSNTPWLTITSGASGYTSGSVNFMVGVNPIDQARSGTLTVGGQTFTVNQAAPIIAPAGVNPSAGSALSQTFTFTFTDAAGYADLSVLDVLVSTFLDGQTACYFALAPTGATTGYIYLVDDAGDGGYAGAPMPLPSAGVVQNSQCAINGTGSSVSASGNTLTLTLAITFKSSFVGNKAIYMAARSNTQNSGWLSLGTWNVPGTVPAGPAVGGVSPARSTSLGQTYTFTFTDSNGYADLFVLDVLTNSFLVGNNACYFAYVPTTPTNGYLYLVDDAGDGGYAPGSPIGLSSGGSLQNNQCVLNTTGSSASASGNTLTLNLAITYKAGFAGNQVFYMAARELRLAGGGLGHGSLIVEQKGRTSVPAESEAR